MIDNQEDNNVDKVYVDLKDLKEGEIYLMEHAIVPGNSILGVYKGRDVSCIDPNHVVLQLISYCSTNPNARVYDLPIGSNVIITGIDNCKFLEL
jgi:hypothetical protein